MPMHRGRACGCRSEHSYVAIALAERGSVREAKAIVTWRVLGEILRHPILELSGDDTFDELPRRFGALV